MKKIKKAVIAAAGRGTRFLPAVKAIPKEMLPVLDKPGIQYIVEELAESGITDIAIVTRGEERDKLYKKHFGDTPELEKYLEESGKTDYLEQIRKISEIANITYITQEGPYGNGTPCLCAKDFIGNEPFIYCFGDDLILSPNKPMARAMIEKYEETDGLIIGVQEIPKEESVRYGMVRLKDEATGEFDYIVEKPEVKDAPSTLAAFGRYLLPPEVIDLLEKGNLGKDNELWMVDAIHEHVRRHGKGYAAKVPDGGQWLTTGDPLRFLKASIEYALAREEFSEDLMLYIKKKAKT